MEDSQFKTSPNGNYDLADMEGEVWESVAEFDGYYEVSNLGRVKSLARLIAPGRGGQTMRLNRARILRPAVNKKDAKLQYLYVHFCIDRRMFTREVHVLVARAFLPIPPPDKTDVTHKNLNTLDNRAANLKYITPKERAVRAYSIGNGRFRSPRPLGDDNPLAKQIHMLNDSGDLIQTFLSRASAAEWLLANGYAKPNIARINVLSAICKAAKKNGASYGFWWKE